MGKEQKGQLAFRLTAANFDFKPTRGTGAGGQNRNKVYSAIQCFHEPSKSMGYAEDSRDQKQNKKLAWKRCIETPEFKAWLRMKADAANGRITITETNEDGQEHTRILNHEEIK